MISSIEGWLRGMSMAQRSAWAVDLVDVALDRARKKTEAAKAKIRFVRADVTRLREHDVGEGFDLVVDMGCLHGLNDAQRDGYATQIKAVRAPKASYFVVAFTPGGSTPPPGIDRAEMVRRFENDWTLVADGDAPVDKSQKRSARWYEHAAR
jgi:SAM-dependent methyltransferase